jgi:hypothetical protein
MSEDANTREKMNEDVGVLRRRVLYPLSYGRRECDE